MIVNTMSYQEIADTMKRDWEQELYNGYKSCFGMREKYRRYVEHRVRAEEFFLFGKREKLTRSQNKYIFLFYTRGRHQYKQVGIIRNFRLEYLRPEGLYAAKINPYRLEEVTFYTPHFFDRYKERFLEGQLGIKDCSKSDVIDDYFINNEAEYGQPQNNPKYPGGIFMTSQDGVLLGEDLGNNIWLYRTFLSFNMLRNGQIDMSGEDKEFLDQALSLYNRGLISIPNEY